MSWIQENKFTASVLGATVVVAGALFYLGNSARSEAEELRTQSNKIVAETNQLKKKQPFPTASNEKLVESKVAAFTKKGIEFQKTLLNYRPQKMPNLSPAAYGSKVSEHIKSLKALYKENGIALPDGGEVAFGMEVYSGGKMASAGATSTLNYKLQALEWLFTQLAEAKPTSLDNVYRAKITEESAPAQTSKKKKLPKKKSVAVESVYRALPVEITFTGTEHSLKQFLATLSNSKDYFFVTRGLRVKNEKQESPNLKDAEFPKPRAEAAGDFEGFDGAADSDTSDSSGEPVLKQVTGDEKIKVHLKLDLVLFKKASEVPFPGAKKAKKKSSSVKSATPNK